MVERAPCVFVQFGVMEEASLDGEAALAITIFEGPLLTKLPCPQLCISCFEFTSPDSSLVLTRLFSSEPSVVVPLM